MLGSKKSRDSPAAVAVAHRRRSIHHLYPGQGRPVEPEERLVNIIFVAVTGIIAWHGLTFRTKQGEHEWVHLLFGCIALLYCLWVLGGDVLGLF